jgi:hypothetical protein
MTHERSMQHRRTQAEHHHTSTYFVQHPNPVQMAAPIGEFAVVKKGESIAKGYTVVDKSYSARQDINLRKPTGMFDFTQLYIAHRPSTVRACWSFPSSWRVFS